ncbi:MAG: FHA domain-containing protein [Acidobacteriota bacterium]|nr:FHA domain-containing protein [Acidobacteriota bacterium]
MAWGDLYKYISEKLESLRHFIDADEPPEDRADRLAFEAERSILQSRAERALQRIAMAVDALLAEEIIRTPSGKAYVPEKFVVFLNPQDDRDWQGRKREFVQQELSQMILAEAEKRAGNSELITKNIEIELRVDGTLETNLVRVQAVLENNRELTVVADNEKTFVVADMREPKEPTGFEEIPADEPFYSVEIRQDGKLKITVPVYKRRAIIGRGMANLPADVPLRESAISRRQAVLELDENGKFWITHAGANPTFVSDEPLVPKIKTPLAPEQTIKMGDFELRIKK